MNDPIEHDLDQGTDEWYEARRGIVTASNVGKLLTSKGAVANNKTATTYAYTIAAERINGFCEDHYQTYDMERGHFQEVLARGIYNDNIAPVRQVGFITRDMGGYTLGASPDGIVGADGGIEIKSRLGRFQIETILADEVPAEFMPQIQATLMVTGRDWWDFIQYSNGMKMYPKRVSHDFKMQLNILEALGAFEVRVASIIKRYHEKSKDMILADYVSMDLDCEITSSTEEA